MEILGHRGSPSAATPENTLASVRAALTAGADGVEVDVRMTADGIAVCCHDPSLERVAGVARRVRTSTAHDLAQVRVSGHRVPTLGDVLDAVNGRGRLVLDLKPENRPRALLMAVADALASTRTALPRLVLSSFDGAVLDECAAMASGIERAAILADAQPVSRVLACAVDRGDSALHVPARTIFAAPDLVAAAHRHGLDVRVWTVNRVMDARLLRLLGVRGVISDVPAELLDALAPAKSGPDRGHLAGPSLLPSFG